jgi:SRSO17 transposase
VTARGHTLIDRELYVPIDWCEDRPRCREAGIPDSVRFQTKPELAQGMLERVFAAQIPVAWVVADTVSGSNLDLRTFLEAEAQAYVLAVPCDEPIGLLSATGRRRLLAEQAAQEVSQQDWHRLSMSEGTKGPRLFDWAALPILHRWQDDGRDFLLIRRSITDPTEKRSSLVFAPPPTQLSEMVEAIGARWASEEDLQTSKGMGLDQYEARTWMAWYRHVTLVMVALAVLTGICASAKSSPLASPDRQKDSLTLALTRPEVCHLLGHLIWSPPCNVSLLLDWSWWRRCHQSRASYYHRRRRLRTG